MNKVNRKICCPSVLLNFHLQWVELMGNVMYFNSVIADNGETLRVCFTDLNRVFSLNSCIVLLMYLYDFRFLLVWKW